MGFNSGFKGLTTYYILLRVYQPVTCTPMLVRKGLNGKTFPVHIMEPYSGSGFIQNSFLDLILGGDE